MDDVESNGPNLDVWIRRRGDRTGVGSGSSLFFSGLYAEARYGFLRARAGGKTDVIGTVADSLTSGSMGTSRNATPMPKVLLRTGDHVDVPGTNEWMKFKGRYEHGWFSNDRFVNDAFLHQKSLHLRGGSPSSIQGHVGLIHKVMWGGTAPDFGRIPQSADEYTRVVFARNGTDDSSSADSAFIYEAGQKGEGRDSVVVELRIASLCTKTRVPARSQQSKAEKSSISFLDQWRCLPTPPEEPSARLVAQLEGVSR